MAISLLTGLLVASGAGSAVVNFFTGRSQAHAAEKAGEQLQEGVREARAYGEPLYDEARRLATEQYNRGQAIAAEQLAQGQRIAAEQHTAGQAQLAPYAQAGGASLWALQKFLGVPSAPTARAAPMAATGPPPSTGPIMAHEFATPPAAAPAPGGTVPLTSLVPGRATPTPAAAAQAATQSSYVTLRAPTGEQRAVPADQVAFYLARGAARI